MRLFSGRRIGQSGDELVLAVFLSFFLHAAVVALALLLYGAVTPKIYIPPFYEVKLVGLAAEQTPSPADAAAPLLPKAAEPAREKPGHKSKKTASRTAKAAPKKGAMPEFTQQKTKPVQPEPDAVAPAPAGPPGKPGSKTEGVVVGSSSEDFKFPPYLAIIKEKIEHNWNPPPSVQGVKAKVQFNVLRSGRVADPKLLESSGNFYFDQAAMRAILLSNPFPPMPDGFYKDHAVFSVDLLEE